MDIQNISCFISPEADGNCGFRAISIAVYGTETRWIEVKDRMLETYIRCEGSLYRDRFGVNEKANIVITLTCKAAPNMNFSHWFGTVDLSQIAADVFQRTAVVDSNVLSRRNRII
ncbi:hypothetical protein BCV72DRAFT_305160 [Rhizopus microsporus var. microsporus]|uniref:OTU domain-containing protein n=2 Tax=Rhizopus microsporus TaxID=58291 RepID=A0A2G4SJ31_RHIZD|nr:uncharacterized protein RHIMIDRAFT_241276 [Rhizopus microsporus ATCC 52813]ORE06844.1 hypothetical protein BCV72DRAFT_305160 [Rhizopus microsporus var. microsporus]PHZ08765.1 hypothetical protein RHIMIDRAFT_241276 [Rhizopus microsporus ATCC 52813]